MNISDILKQRRSELDLTLKYIADYIGVSEATVQRWESGNIKNLRHSGIVKLAEVLKMHPGDLMGWDDKGRIYGDSLPAELKDLDIEWVMVAKKAKDSGLTPDELAQLIDAIKNIKK